MKSSSSSVAEVDVAEASNLRRQIRELQKRIRDSRAAGNGNRPELATRIEALRADLYARFGEGQMPASGWTTRCTAVGVKPVSPIVKLAERWTTRCPDCSRVVKVHMPRMNTETRIGAHNS